MLWVLMLSLFVSFRLFSPQMWSWRICLVFSSSDSEGCQGVQCSCCGRQWWCSCRERGRGEIESAYALILLPGLCTGLFYCLISAESLECLHLHSELSAMSAIRWLSVIGVSAINVHFPLSTVMGMHHLRIKHRVWAGWSRAGLWHCPIPDSPSKEENKGWAGGSQCHSGIHLPKHCMWTQVLLK